MVDYNGKQDCTITSPTSSEILISTNFTEAALAEKFDGNFKCDVRLQCPDVKDIRTFINFKHYKMNYLYNHKLEISALTDQGYSNEIDLNMWKTPKTIPTTFISTNLTLNVKFEMQYTTEITDTDLGFQLRFWCDGNYFILFKIYTNICGSQIVTL